MTTIYRIEYRRGTAYEWKPSPYPFTDYEQACEQARSMLRLASVVEARVIEVESTEVFTISAVGDGYQTGASR